MFGTCDSCLQKASTQDYQKEGTAKYNLCQSCKTELFRKEIGERSVNLTFKNLWQAFKEWLGRRLFNLYGR